MKKYEFDIEDLNKQIKKYEFDIEDLNKQIKKIRKVSTQKTFFDTQQVRQKYNRIIKVTKSKKTGKTTSSVMTYEQSLKNLKKHAASNYKEGDFTEQDYQKEIQNLISSAENATFNRLTIEGEMEYQLEYMKNIIKDAFEVDYSIENYELLKKTFEIAQHSQGYGKSKNESGGEYINDLEIIYNQLKDDFTFFDEMWD